VVVSNPDKKTMEMGLFRGAPVSVVKNSPGDPNMVVAVGRSRYMISRTTAETIAVRQD